MKTELQKVYGSYSVPKEIDKLYKLEEELMKAGYSLATIGFRPCEDYFHYSITPPDLIPFAETGGDGIHFGFLTDFSQVLDLNEAPIVCVSPTNDPPIRYIARNIKEFLDLATSVPYVEMLESCWAYSKEQFEEECKQFHEDSTAEWKMMSQKIFKRFQEVFSTKAVDLNSYFKEVKDERNNAVVISTMDGLGVIGKKLDGQVYKSYSFDFQHAVEANELKRMREFLVQASRVEKLAFIRDANYRYVVARGYDEAILDLIVEQLQAMELHVEARGMLARS